MRDMDKLLECRIRHTDFKALGKLRLELERRNNGNEISVAAPLTEAVERALDLARTCTHCGERIGDRLIRIVMCVNADVIAWNGFHHLANDLFDLVRQRAAIGIA